MTGDLRAPRGVELHGTPIGVSEVVYAFVALDSPAGEYDLALLDEDERGRATRFVHEVDRQRFAIAHAALRRLLGRCVGVDPAAIRYETNPQGKPRLAGGRDRLEFNVAHSHDLAVVAVTRGRSVGVDLERLDEVPDTADLAEVHFSEREQRALRAVAPTARSELFLRYWTRKEAVIKASGEGLSRALHDFDVDVAPRIVSIPGGRGETERWALADLPAPVGYLAAGAVSPGAEPPRWREL